SLRSLEVQPKPWVSAKAPSEPESLRRQRRCALRLVGALVTLTASQRPRRGACKTEHPPPHRALLDRPPKLAGGQRGEHHWPAAPGGGGYMVEQAQHRVRPFELVALVADGEVEAPKTFLDGALQQVAQVGGARAEACQRPVVIARQHVIIGAAEAQAEIG